jgi:Family of unknown function (DUF6064)
MSEWWTYSLSDLILFSSHAYYRLIELYNTAIWPAQIVALLLGVAILVLVRRGSSGRWVAILLAACWLWIALAFHAARYARLNTAAPYFAWMFGIEAALLVVLSRMTFQGPFDIQGRIGLAIFLFALVVMPLAAPLLSRGWRAAEVFGMAPDPTAVGTLGILLVSRVKRRWPLMVLPAAWCVVTGAILSVWKISFFWMAPLLALIAVLLARRR